MKSQNDVHLFSPLVAQLSLMLLLCCANLCNGQGVAEADAVDKKMSPRTFEIKRDVLYRESDGLTEHQRRLCRLDLYCPVTGASENGKKFPTLIWFHGGGLTSGDKHLPDALKNQGIIVVTVNYRLHPKVKSPAYIDDAAAATAWVFENIEKYGGDTDNIFVSGHSAGGYLALMLGMDKQYLAAYGVDCDRIAGLIPYSGHTITHFTVRAERGIEKEQPIVDEMAPLFHVRADSPPALLITGDRDKELLGRYEETAYFWRMMQVKNHPSCRLIEIEDCNHGQMVEPAHKKMLNFIRANTK